MQPPSTYEWLIDGGKAELCDPFDVHVLASILAMAIGEMHAGAASLTHGTGLPTQTLAAILRAVFPQALPLLDRDGADIEPFVPEDEHCLRELLVRSTTQRTQFQLHLAWIIARRSMRPNHLWQDLGLRNRGELSELMRRHFKPLALRNSHDMKWKKFFYRMICRDEGFSLCTAPTCAECDDFTACFSDESGESLLARTRKDSELRLPRIQQISNRSDVSES